MIRLEMAQRAVGAGPFNWVDHFYTNIREAAFTLGKEEIEEYTNATARIDAIADTVRSAGDVSASKVEGS